MICEHCGRSLGACVGSPCEQALIRQGLAFQPDPSPYTLASMPFSFRDARGKTHYYRSW